MAEDFTRKDFIRYLDEIIGRHKLIKEDPEVQKRLEILFEQEIDFYSFLLTLEFEKTPSGETTFGKKVAQDTNMSFKMWVGKIFEKFNSIIGKLIVPLP